MACDLKVLVEQLKAVSHPLRLRVLALLGSGELSVCQVAEVLQVPASSASEALRELRRAGFVEERREGRRVFVSVAPGVAASPMGQGILAEALLVPEARQDLARVGAVKAMALATVCARVRG